MTVFYTADTHFGHEAVIRMCARPFADVREMNEALVANWNAVVRPNDLVHLVGDFAYKMPADEMARLRRRLNGRIELTIGNHDGEATLALPWASAPAPRRTISDKGRRIVLDHYAMRTWQGRGRGTIHLFGHSHGRLPPFGRSIDVGVDSFGFRPVTIEEIEARLPETAYEPDDPEFAQAALDPQV